MTLTDGKNQITTWTHDIFGRMSNKVDAASNEVFRYGYDANGRLTSRLTPAKGTTYMTATNSKASAFYFKNNTGAASRY